MTAKSKADDLRSVLDLRGYVDLEYVLNMLGLTSYDREMDPGIQEVKRDNLIAVREDLSPEWKRFVIAHAIGHHQMHVGNQLFMRRETMLADPIERQADVFAMRLLVNVPEAIREGINQPWEIAEHFGVPEEIIVGQGMMF